MNLRQFLFVFSSKEDMMTCMIFKFLPVQYHHIHPLHCWYFVHIFVTITSFLLSNSIFPALSNQGFHVELISISMFKHCQIQLIINFHYNHSSVIHNGTASFATRNIIAGGDWVSMRVLVHFLLLHPQIVWSHRYAKSSVCYFLFFFTTTTSYFYHMNLILFYFLVPPDYFIFYCTCL